MILLIHVSFACESAEVGSYYATMEKGASGHKWHYKVFKMAVATVKSRPPHKVAFCGRSNCFQQIIGRFVYIWNWRSDVSDGRKGVNSFLYLLLLPRSFSFSFSPLYLHISPLYPSLLSISISPIYLHLSHISPIYLHLSHISPSLPSISISPLYLHLSHPQMSSIRNVGGFGQSPFPLLSSISLPIPVTVFFLVSLGPVL